MSFPPGFRWGAATAAFQIEGATGEDGRGESIWDRFCRTPGAIDTRENGDVACDHYHRWAEDLDLLVALGIPAYRFSIAWPRIQPTGSGAVNEAGVNFYRRLVEGLHERGITPMATRYHWDLPQALQDEGGWAARDTVDRFVDYAAVVTDRLGDVLPTITTFNEPEVVAFRGHATGRHAPGIRDWRTAVQVSHHLHLAHGRAVPAIRSLAPASTRVGAVYNLATAHPASDSDADRAAAVLMDGYANRWWLDPALLGSYPADLVEAYERSIGPLDFIRDGDLAEIRAAVDYVGVNYYSCSRVRAEPRAEFLGIAKEPPREPVTAMGWEVAPDSLYEMLTRIKRDYGDLPIYITENGAAYDDDVAADGSV
ncbi:MAG TPA: family 1 glycosylhydrolase, partial [Mycobacteriales bacterium]|nr:family 1 glycosylhydrolase [Mycobacteriales bacterium]